jgi:hypothetical protein
MNHRIVAIAVTAAFASGLVVGHYAGPRDLKVSRQGVERTNKPIAGASARWAEADPPGALAYVQAKGGRAENNRLLSSVVRTWTQQNAAAAMTWVTHLQAAGNVAKLLNLLFLFSSRKIQRMP